MHKNYLSDMKQSFFITCAVIFLSLLACSGEKAENQQNAEQVVQQVEDSATVIGKWVDADNKGFELVDDCSAKAINNPDVEYQEWSANEAGDTLTIVTSTDTATYAMKFAGTQLTLTGKDGNATTYKRQK